MENKEDECMSPILKSKILILEIYWTLSSTNDTLRPFISSIELQHQKDMSQKNCHPIANLEESSYQLVRKHMMDNNKQPFLFLMATSWQKGNKG